ncbi:hypothetical protein HOT79_gp35 [Shigella phage SFPH2]|uniref:Uncharacterized protein n=1 Tax=Shigella phage SFPH2 TaxID=2269380 RepID=A0A345AVB8_9CAUD|nr:hypothetical protein HOT79_gp35 [Shigella phage SFPH2]AXF40851.1 hypothetical protein [Shigella phage SFPH2]
MRNLINGKTLTELQLELGPKEGLEVFTSRCTGRTLGRALLFISTAMVQGSIDIGTLRGNLGDQEVDSTKYQITQRLDQMGLVGFKLEGDVLSYYPFEEHQDVKEVVREVKVQVSPFAGEVVSPRSYSVEQHPEGPAVPVSSMEQSYPEVRVSSGASPVVEPMETIEPLVPDMTPPKA